MSLDVIGDIHGHYDKLTALLAKLGYREQAGAWRHPDRSAVFVGDLIDRAVKQVETVELVRSMVDAGSAQCIMGNHEFNAIAWATPDPERAGEYLRPHTEANRKQHCAFLNDVTEESTRHEEYVRWFKTLPLWIDFGRLRVVHACWDQASMDWLSTHGLTPTRTLTDDLIVRASRKHSDAYKAIEVVCKGPEATLPNGLSFRDKEKKERHEVRIKWWAADLSSFQTAADVPEKFAATIPDEPLPEPWRSFSYVGPATIFGHYWRTGRPSVLSPQLACVDYSVANGGPLVAYQWDGESVLEDNKMVSV